MVRVAIPIFQSRVSPVFDTCTRVLLLDVEKNREIKRSEIDLDLLSLPDRVNLLQKLRVRTVICGGISDILHNMLKSAKIRMIAGVAGEVEQVFSAYVSDRLDEPRFHMPGYKARK